MIKFFRKIRQNLLSEGKTGKYFKYAIGEIVLVVIGILIALSINNWNEIRKTENKIIATLKEVQNDLGTDIQKSDELIEYYKETDSIINLIKTDKLRREDYEQKNLRYLIMSARHIKIHINGYTNLMEDIDNIPKHLQEIIAPLNVIYVYNKYDIDQYDERLYEITTRIIDELANTKDWYYKLDDENLSDEAISYFLNDPHYKNAADLYQNAGWINLSDHLKRFRANAVKSYKKINVLLKDEETLPSFIPDNSFDLTQAQLNEYIGLYKLIKIENYNESIPNIVLKFWIADNQLIVARTDDVEDITLLYFEDLDKAFENSDIYEKFQFVRNSSNNVSEIVYRSGRNTFHLKKIEEITQAQQGL